MKLRGTGVNDVNVVHCLFDTSKYSQICEGGWEESTEKEGKDEKRERRNQPKFYKVESLT